MGSGTVSISASGNTSTSARTGTLTVAGQLVTVQQAAATQPAAACATVSPASASFGNQGGPATLTISAVASCSWRVDASDAWIGWANAVPGSGNAILQYNVQPNYGSTSRSGTITVRNQGTTVAWQVTVRVTQAASTYLEFRGNYSLEIRVAPGCYANWPESMRLVSVPCTVRVDDYLNGATDAALLGLPIPPSYTHREVRFSGTPTSSFIDSLDLLISVGGTQWDLSGGGLVTPTVGVTRGSDGRGEIVNARFGDMRLLAVSGSGFPWECGYENYWSLKIR